MPKIKPTGHGGVYEIVNLVNGKRYIGSAAYFNKRWHQHRNDLRHGTHHTPHLQHSWNKYGESEFSFRVLEIVPEPTRQRLIDYENKWFKELGYHYNVAPIAGSRLGVPQSEAARAAMSRFHSQHWKDPENLARRAAAISAGYTAESRARKSADATARGDGARLKSPEAEAKRKTYHARLRGKLPAHLHTSEMRERMAEGRRRRRASHFVISPQCREAARAANTGRKHTPEEIAKRSAALTGITKKPHTEETKAKISATLKGAGAGRVFSEETREKIAASKRGKKRSPEACAAMALAQQRRFANPEERAKMAARKTGLAHSDETRAKMSTSHKRRHELQEGMIAVRPIALSQ